jgi:hypothetical protein
MVKRSASSAPATVLATSNKNKTARFTFPV